MSASLLATSFSHIRGIYNRHLWFFW